MTPSSTLRNDYGGWVGFKFTVGASPIVVSQLGRWVVSGNSQSHTVKLVDAAGNDLSGGAAVVTTSGATAGQFKYAALGSGITLSANTTYMIVSQEYQGGDLWYDYDSTMATTSAGTIKRGAHTPTGSAPYYFWPWYDGVFGYVPVNFTYGAGTGWQLAGETHYVYDGMRVIQERDGGNNPTVSYTRGLDLSGSFEGAGGIGGLLARTEGGSHAYYHADGMGNISVLADASQAVVASYRYDSYGNLLSASGTLAAANRYRFSSKEVQASSGLYYYGYRFYDPNNQRWLNRDPIEEEGGVNLFQFVFNQPINAYDSYGLIAPLPIIGAGNAIGHGLIGAWEGIQYFKCLKETQEMDRLAAARLDAEAAVRWCHANRADQCLPLLGDAGLNLIKAGTWGVGRLLLIKIGVNPIFGGRVGMN